MKHNPIKRQMETIKETQRQIREGCSRPRDADGAVETVISGTPEWEAFKEEFEAEMYPILREQQRARARSAIESMNKIISENAKM